MDELEKIVRVLGKLDPEAPHTVLQTLDATTGQNALNQVEIFRNIAGRQRAGDDQARRHGARRHSCRIAAKHKCRSISSASANRLPILNPSRQRNLPQPLPEQNNET
jgi:hypothetical protein